MKLRNICIIPARGGSKRIKNKNIILLNGKPIISYAIDICKKSKIFEKIIVSTDSPKISAIVKKYGITVPRLRPKIISNDNSSINSIIKYEYKNHCLNEYDYIFCFFPTAVLLEPKDLRNGLKKIVNLNASHLLTISPYKNPIQRAIKISKNKLKYISNINIKKRTQHLKKSYFDTGGFFAHKVSDYSRKFNDKPKNSIGFVLDQIKSLDINDIEDLMMLKILFKNKYKKS